MNWSFWPLDSSSVKVYIDFNFNSSSFRVKFSSVARIRIVQQFEKKKGNLTENNQTREFDEE